MINPAFSKRKRRKNDPSKADYQQTTQQRERSSKLSDRSRLSY
jgi:hypothetical protein